MSKAIIHILLKLLFKIIAHIEIDGLEKMPREGSFILVANHLGVLDAMLLVHLFHLFDRDDYIVMVAEKYQHKPVYRWAVSTMGFLWLDRFNPDLPTLREVYKRLRMGHFLVMSPEGTRSQTGALIEGKPGAAYLAAKAGATIIPAGLTGTEDKAAKKKILRLQRVSIRIKVGEPFDLPKIPQKDREAFLQRYTDEIMARIAALLPPQYRGVYSQHPRLRELLASSGTGGDK